MGVFVSGKNSSPAGGLNSLLLSCFLLSCLFLCHRIFILCTIFYSTFLVPPSTYNYKSIHAQKVTCKRNVWITQKNFQILEFEICKLVWALMPGTWAFILTHHPRWRPPTKSYMSATESGVQGQQMEYTSRLRSRQATQNPPKRVLCDFVGGSRNIAILSRQAKLGNTPICRPLYSPNPKSQPPTAWAECQLWFGLCNRRQLASPALKVYPFLPA